jgi:hypothetical protein
MQVELFGDKTPGAVFEGTYIVLPAKPLARMKRVGTRRSNLLFTLSGVLNPPGDIPHNVSR